MHEELWRRLSKLDCQQTVQRAKCQYLSDPARYIVTLLNTEYIINLAELQIFSVRAGSPLAPAEFLEQLCLLAYLLNAKDLPLADKLVKAETLSGGQFFFRGPHTLPTKKLQETFGRQPNLLYQAANHMDAKKLDFGDVSVELLVLPRIPLTFVIWAGDGQFQARASILFDQTASVQLPLDALLTAANLAVDALVNAAQTGN